MFVPRGAIAYAGHRPRIGEMLVELRAATREQVERAEAEQQEMRAQQARRHPAGEAGRHARPAAGAIEQQSRCRWCASARRWWRWAWSPRSSSTRRWSSRSSTAACRSARCWCAWGVVSRESLQTALARKMGYPLVDVDAFPIEAEALRRVNLASRARLQVPLMMRDGAPCRRTRRPVRRSGARRDRVHRQMKVVPVLASHGDIDEVLQQSPTRRSAHRPEGRRPAADPIDRVRPRRRQPAAGDAWSAAASARAPTRTRRSSRATTRWCG